MVRAWRCGAPPTFALTVTLKFESEFVFFFCQCCVHVSPYKWPVKFPVPYHAYLFSCLLAEDIFRKIDSIAGIHLGPDKAAESSLIT